MKPTKKKSVRMKTVKAWAILTKRGAFRALTWEKPYTSDGIIGYSEFEVYPPDQHRVVRVKIEEVK